MKLARLIKKVVFLPHRLRAGGWKLRPKVWVERKDREDNKGYFPRTKGDSQ